MREHVCAYMCLMACLCLSTCVEVRGWLVGAGSLLPPCWPCPDPMSHLTYPQFLTEEAGNWKVKSKVSALHHAVPQRSLLMPSAVTRRLLPWTPVYAFSLILPLFLTQNLPGTFSFFHFLKHRKHSLSQNVLVPSAWNTFLTVGLAVSSGFTLIITNMEFLAHTVRINTAYCHLP